MYQPHGKLPVPKNRTEIVVLESNLTAVGALAIERRLIRIWGRCDLGTGILRNRTDGGDGVYGNSGVNHPMYGRCRPDLSERNREMSGENHPANKPGYIPPRLGAKANEETREKLRQRWKKQDHPMLGKFHSDESKAAMSVKRKGVKTGKTWNRGIPASDETKIKLKEKRAGKMWFNDGVNCTMSRDSPGEGWVRGRLWNK